MVQYYNMTGFSETEGFMDFLRILSSMVGYWFGLMLLGLLFLIPLIIMLNRNEEPNRAFMISSLYAVVGGAIFYVTGIVPNGLVFYIPMLILVTTVAIRWYNK